jgi:hypothetical protein
MSGGDRAAYSPDYLDNFGGYAERYPPFMLKSLLALTQGKGMPVWTLRATHHILL